jgi:hypothetical protein
MRMPPKKPSGAEFKKLKKKREEKECPLGIHLKNCLSISTLSDNRPSGLSSDKVNFENTPSPGNYSTVMSISTSDNRPSSSSSDQVNFENTPSPGTYSTVMSISTSSVNSPFSSSYDQVNFENIQSCGTSSTIIVFNPNITSFITDNSETETELLEPISNSHIDFSDLAKWPLLNDEIRVAIVEYGFHHNDLSNYIFPEDSDGRHFSSKWLYKNVPNGKKV